MNSGLVIEAGKLFSPLLVGVMQSGALFLALCWLQASGWLQLLAAGLMHSLMAARPWRQVSGNRNDEKDIVRSGVGECHPSYMHHSASMEEAFSGS